MLVYLSVCLSIYLCIRDGSRGINGKWHSLIYVELKIPKIPTLRNEKTLNNEKEILKQEKNKNKRYKTLPGVDVINLLWP
jgi:hypothetical protein